MESENWVELLAIVSVILGSIIEFFPYLLAGIAPQLSSTAILQIGYFSIPANTLYGFILIGGGAFVFFYYLWWSVE